MGRGRRSGAWSVDGGKSLAAGTVSRDVVTASAAVTGVASGTGCLVTGLG